MTEMSYQAFVMVCGPSIGNRTVLFLKRIFEAASGVASMSQLGAAMGIFSGIAASLISVFFFVDIMDKASKDMITLEKLIVSFIKLILTFTIVLTIKDFAIGTFNLGANIFYYAETEWFGTSNTGSGTQVITYFGEETPPKWETVEEKLVGKNKPYGKGFIKNSLNALGILVGLLIPWIVTLGAIAASYFVSITTMLTFFVMALFSPIAVSQCFDEGQRSTGIRYLKKMMAAALTFAVIMGFIYAGSLLENNLMVALVKDANLSGLTTAGSGTTLDINETNYNAICKGNAGFLVSIVILKAAVIGGVMKAGSVANAIFGVPW